MYRVVVRPKAAKSLSRIDNKYQRRLNTALVLLQSDPYSGKPLIGKYIGYLSLRVWPYRIVYAVDKPRKTVLVIAIGHRQGIYR